MKISISKTPVVDNQGKMVDSVTVIVTNNDPAETVKDVLQTYNTIIEELKKEGK